MKRVARFRARLDRLEKALGRTVEDDFGFPIDLALAMAIRKDDLKLRQLRQKSRSEQPGDAPSPERKQEIARLEASIEEKVREIPCPASYGEKRYRHELILGYQQFCRAASSTDAVKEEALSLARSLAYLESPEGQGRARIRELSSTFSTAAEKNELEALLKRYPEMPLDPDHPLAEAMKAWEAAPEAQ